MANEYYNANPSTDADPAHGLATRAYSADYLEGLYAGKSAWKKLKNETANASLGESVTLGVFPALTAVDVNQSTGSFSYINTSVTAATIVIDHEKAVPVSLREPLIKQAKVDIKSAFAREAGKACADAIDAELVELFAAMTTNTAGSLGADLTDAYVLNALQDLVTKNVSLVDPSMFVWVLPGTQYGAVKGLKDYGNYSINAGSSMSEGMADLRAHIDTLYGIDVVFRNDSAMSITGGKYGALLHRDSVGVAISKNISMREPQWIPGTTNLEMVTSVLFGIDTLDKNRCVRISTN